MPKQGNLTPCVLRAFPCQVVGLSKNHFFLKNLFNTSMVEKVKNFWVFNLFKSRFFETERKNAKSFPHFQHVKV